MCYNNKCKIEIKSCIDDSTSTTVTNGRVIKMPSDVRFDYVLDGDECTLTVNNNEAVQTRRGKQNIKMIFRKGEQTECFLESGGLSGSFTVFTHDLQFADCGINVLPGKMITVSTLSIVYTLGEEKIELNFSAEYKNIAKVKK